MKVHLNPAFGDLTLRELTLEILQHYFGRLQTTKMSPEGVDKVKDVLSAVLGTAVTYGRLSTYPAEHRYCRGDWDEPKSDASRATIAVDDHVIERIQKLKSIEVVIRAGRAFQRYKTVKSDGPDDLVFQSVKTGAPIRDNIVLCRHIKPAARKLGAGWVNWQVLRRSYATWMSQAQVNVKDARGLMRHSRASTTQDVYQQVVPESQRKAVQKLSAFVKQSSKEAVAVQ